MISRLRCRTSAGTISIMVGGMLGRMTNELIVATTSGMTGGIINQTVSRTKKELSAEIIGAIISSCDNGKQPID